MTLDSIVEDYAMGEFKACVIVNEDMQLVEVFFEDVSYISEPVFPGVYHYFDKYLAMDDKRVVGACLWHTQSIIKEPEDSDLDLYKVFLGMSVLYSLAITFIFIANIYTN